MIFLFWNNLHAKCLCLFFERNIVSIFVEKITILMWNGKVQSVSVQGKDEEPV